ncbi:PREDICTED: uncharacterized protein LOC109114437 [Nelumbo nucifera]|uniref:Uncharacterized protein LOC109114437 n=1 Tax=Nelumbo nucifera TaxID=4432 RepID=A0A1U8Q1F0_NELNU|nr:PREDICTED: uncharacterized protein LOC109114437 [Nelumbo nucifera]
MAVIEKLSKEDGAELVDASIYRSLVGSLIYFTKTRSDIVLTVSIVLRYMNKPSKVHFGSAKRILRYVKGTKKFELKYESENCKLVGFSDSDWDGAIDERKSTTTYVFSLGSKMISWPSKKKNTVALSSAEVEYISATSASCEAIWLKI